MLTRPQIIGNMIIETAVTPSNYDLKYVGERNGRVLAEGVLQEANMCNRNSRFYDSKELFPQLVDPRQLELLRTGNMRAENGHPLTKDLTRQQTIDPNNTVAIFTKFWTDGDFVCGTYFGTFNDKGEEFNKELIAGILPSWSLRALGTIVNTGRGAEVRGIKIITYDRVIYPSHNKAYTKGIISESTGSTVDIGRYSVQEGSNLYLHDNDRGIITPITNESAISYIKSESANIKLIRETLDFAYDDIELLESGKSVKLTDKSGVSVVVYLEDYIHNEIQNECVDIYNKLA